MAVHSIKDMPVELPPGLHLASVPLREDRRDVFISASGLGLMELPEGGPGGHLQSAPDRFVAFLRPDLEVVSLRGNVDTRLRKMEEGQVEAIILAAAGLSRMGLSRRITEFLPPQKMLPAVGQGALGLECRQDDQETNRILGKLNHPRTWMEIQAERAFWPGWKAVARCPSPVLRRFGRPP